MEVLELLGLIIFGIGIVGISINKKNIIVTLMSIELMLLGINYIYIINYLQNDEALGILIVIMVLTVAAAETAIGLTLVVLFYKTRGSIGSKYIKILKG